MSIEKHLVSSAGSCMLLLSSICAAADRIAEVTVTATRAYSAR